MRKFRYNRRIMYFCLSFLIILILTISVAYAVLGVTLNIVGNTEVLASDWNVHLENAVVKTGSVNTNIPTITNGVTANFSAHLDIPGDFYEFTIDVKNDGSLNAMIESISKTSLSLEQRKYLNYEIEYENGTSIFEKQLLRVGEFLRLKVRVEFMKNISNSDLPSSETNLNLSFSINYVQSSEDDELIIVPDNGTIKENPVKFVSGDGTNVGDRIQIGEEYFRVLSNNNGRISMITEYCLDVVGNSQTSNTEFSYDFTESDKYHNVVFSSTSFWSNQGLSYAVPYPYVYNSYNGHLDETHATLIGYINNYKDKLISLGVNVQEARLINWDEMTVTNCTTINSLCGGSEYTWMSPEQFWWTGVMVDENNVIYVDSSSLSNLDYRFDCGIRPVIVIITDNN